MATSLKLRRGTTTAHSTFTGAEGEVTVDTTKDTIVVHDGSTAGGFPLLKENNPLYTGTLTGGTGVINLGSGQFYKASGGNVGIGTSSPVSKLNIYDATSAFIRTQSDAASGTYTEQYVNSTSGPTIAIRKSRGTVASPSAANGGDGLGSLTWQAYGGSNFRNIGLINSVVETYTSDTNISGALVFQTNTGSTNVTEQMRITAAGNVGIGTSSPGSLLTVNGEIQVRNANTQQGKIYGTGSALRIENTSSTPIVFLQNTGTEYMRIDSSGNVGIGAASGGAKLHVQQDQAAYSYLDFYNVTNGGGVVWRQITRNLANTGTTSVDLAKLINSGFTINNNDTGSGNFTSFGIGGSERMRIDSNGNVGIGTSSPGSKLHVYGNYISLADGSYTGYLGKASNVIASGGVSDLGLSAIGNLAFGTGGSLAERMRIDSSGNVMVGTTSANGRFTAETASTTQRTIHAGSSSGSITTDGIIYSYTNTTSGTGFNHFAAQSGSSGLVFRVLGTGTVQNTTGTYTTISDAKLKENIVDIAPQLERLMNVRVVNYNLIGDELKQAGWIAQELETVYPKLVFETPDRDENGEMNGEYTKGVKQSVFIPLLVKALQELKAELDVVKSELNTLKGN